MNNEIFTVTARRCRRCGRLLVNKEAVAKGIGCQCEIRERQEERDKQPLPGQMSIFDYWEE